MEGLITIMGNGFADIQANVISVVSLAAPVVITILGILVIWGFAFTFFKNMGSK
ncbi:unnamed protein product [marine sediment metagenome]|uniref:Uncharacterized protein n=1 Tax=marine sediment metagenome TaxID=412755 RepID=X1H937_9ZZZZ